jgi:formamidopyrimidine-DNA glycosylase
VPELPDVAIYVERLRALTVGKPLEGMRIASPFILRTVTPSPASFAGVTVVDVERMGKRILFALEGERFVVIHLMIAGRLRWHPRGTKIPGKVGLVAFDFPNGTLIFTEASPKKRASLHLVSGRAALADFDRGGLDVFAATAAQFAERLRSERHTVKRSLTDPTLFDGIGNAYSDEILHAARLSPFRMTTAMTDDEIERLHRACIGTLTEWTERFRAEVGDGFPDKVTAFRPEMAVHGKYGEPCPVCLTKVQRIVYADNEANYCPTCQTDGKLLADRSLSRLLKEDWPKSLEELEERKRGMVAPSVAPAAAPAKAPKPAAKSRAWTSNIPTRAAAAPPTAPTAPAELPEARGRALVPEKPKRTRKS